MICKTSATPLDMRSVEEAMAIANGVDGTVRSTLEQRILDAGTAPIGKPRSPGAYLSGVFLPEPVAWEDREIR